MEPAAISPPAVPPAAPPLPLELARFRLPPVEAVVRPLRQADCRDLEWHGGPDLRSFYELQYQRHSRGEIAVLVIEWNGACVAQSAIHWSGKPTHPHIPDIQSLRVLPLFRGLGLGTRLLAASEAVIAGRGYNEVSLAVSIDNPRARALYERVGYVLVGEPYRDDWSYADAAGQTRRVRETVVDLIKPLQPCEP